MKAAVYKQPGVLEVEDVPDPEVGPHDVLLQITHCAICGSDLHRYSYGMLRPGSIIGHEYSGKVIAKGNEVQAYRIGDRVMRGKDYTPTPARFSAKEKGFSSIQRDRAYAEYLAVNAEGVMKVPESVTNLEACLAEPLSVALHAVRVSAIRLGDQVLVLGAGPVGLLTQQCAALSGALKVYVSDINAARRTMATSLGASMVFDPTSINLVEEIVKRTEVGVDLAFECAGASPTLQQGLEAVRTSGRVIVVSLAWEPVRCVPVEWVGREVEMKAVYGALADEWPIASKLLESRRISVKPLISKIVSLGEIQEAFQELLKPNTGWVQVVVAFE
jgi:2-desacetyl-2-hydroxyethyl bacteriochlorophyllide A dehydrogenase